MLAHQKRTRSAKEIPEKVVPIEDRAIGLEAVIVIHSTALGPAAGGCRLWHYPDLASAHLDALRLASGMSYKNALAALPLGGGKAVVRAPDGSYDRQRLFAAIGRAVDDLGGRFVTAEDVGTTVADMTTIQRHTQYVAGLAARSDRPGGDPSPHTARGVFEAMAVAVEYRLGRSLADTTVAVQGLGHVGFALCEMLHATGARLMVSEPRTDVAAKAAHSFGATVVDGPSIYDAQADVFAPCALGASLDESTVARLRAKIVCGAANNQLANASVGEMLARREVLYAPDYLVNAGGIINVAGEYLGWSKAEVDTRVGAIAPRLKSLLCQAQQNGARPEYEADRMASAIIDAATNGQGI